jgi:hypothetical protein
VNDMNNKAVSTSLVVVIILVIIVALVAAAFSIGSSPAVNNSEVKVYIDTVLQTGNYTQPQTLTWTNAQAGNTYTKNFTVVNSGAQTYNLLLLTSEPSGATQTWAFNNTIIGPASYSAATLTLTLTPSASAGTYTWRLFATNNSLIQPTPTPNPSATPTPNALSYTLKATAGIQNITVTFNTQLPFVVLASELSGNGKTYSLTAGDNIKLQAGLDQYYTWNGWQFDDGTMPHMNNPIILANIQGNFTVSAQALMTQP